MYAMQSHEKISHFQAQLRKEEKGKGEKGLGSLSSYKIQVGVEGRAEKVEELWNFAADTIQPIHPVPYVNKAKA